MSSDKKLLDSPYPVPHDLHNWVCAHRRARALTEAAATQLCHNLAHDYKNEWDRFDALIKVLQNALGSDDCFIPLPRDKSKVFDDSVNVCVLVIPLMLIPETVVMLLKHVQSEQKRLFSSFQLKLDGQRCEQPEFGALRLYVSEIATE